MKMHIVYMYETINRVLYVKVHDVFRFYFSLWLLHTCSASVIIDSSQLQHKILVVLSVLHRFVVEPAFGTRGGGTIGYRFAGYDWFYG